MASAPLSLLISILTFLWIVRCIRCDPVEGSRLLEEAFRDYDKRIRPNFGGSPVFVNVSIYILSVSKVDTSDMTYSVSFFIRQIWNDGRLSFNSRRNIDTITLAGSLSERIWTPDTYFVNELSSVDHETLVKNQFCRISQDGMVLLSRRVTLTLFSPMKLTLFPYDSHALLLEMESYGSQSRDLKYLWTSDVDSSSLSPPGFSITGFSTRDSSKTTDTGTYSSLTIEINVRRHPFSYEIGIMLPTTILVILCLGGMHLRRSKTGIFIVMFSISATMILYGQIVLSQPGTLYFTPLHLYMLLSIGFNCLCLLFILKHDKESLHEAFNQNPDLCNGNKSRTESTSEDCKLEEIKSDGTSPETLNRQCPVALVKGKDSEKVWGKLVNRLNFREKEGDNSGYQCYNCILAILWSVFVSANVLFFVVFRCLQSLQ